jgi:putative transposase
VDKRTIFQEEKDYLRFVHQLYEFNDEDPVLNVTYYFNPKTKSVEAWKEKKQLKIRKLLVDILVFTLMPNHFHLMIRQKVDNGIIKFMQKLGTGYTMYFNNKYDRSGSLFQGRFKAVMLDRQEHFHYLPYYIHTNPLSLNYGGSTSIDWQKKFDFLVNYRWSSFPDYIGNQNFPSVIHSDYLLNVFGGEKEFKSHMESYLREDADGDFLEGLEDIVID